MNNSIEILVQKAKEGDSLAMQTILNDYKSMVRSVVNKFFLTSCDKEDLFSEGLLGLFSAVMSFEKSKGAFPSFAKLCVFRAVAAAVKFENSDKNKALRDSVELDDFDNIALSQSDPLEKMLSEETQEIILNTLSKSETTVLQLFLEGFSYIEIASKTGKSTKSVDGAMQRVRKKLTTIFEGTA